MCSETCFIVRGQFSLVKLVLAVPNFDNISEIHIANLQFSPIIVYKPLDV